jgi:hypothetical protein
MSLINCPNCGKQYHYNNQFAGKQVRCQACGNMFQMPVIKDDGLELVPRSRSVGTCAAAGRAHRRHQWRMDDYQLLAMMQFAEVTLDPNEW